MGDDIHWYEDLRELYRPGHLRVLLIGESPPASDNGARRFFYAPELTGHDNLFRSAALAAYGYTKADLAERPKASVLRRLQEDGIWLIDAVEHAINHHTANARTAAIRASVQSLIDRWHALDPEHGVFICSTPVHRAAAAPLASAGITVCNSEPAPFPLGNARARFVGLWRRDIPGSWPN